MQPSELKKIRSKLGLSQAALAERLGVDRNTVNRWEMGIRKIPLIAIKLLSTFR